MQLTSGRFIRATLIADHPAFGFCQSDKCRHGQFVKATHGSQRFDMLLAERLCGKTKRELEWEGPNCSPEWRRRLEKRHCYQNTYLTELCKTNSARVDVFKVLHSERLQTTNEICQGPFEVDVSLDFILKRRCFNAKKVEFCDRLACLCSLTPFEFRWSWFMVTAHTAKVVFCSGWPFSEPLIRIPLFLHHGSLEGGSIVSLVVIFVRR